MTGVRRSIIAVMLGLGAVRGAAAQPATPPLDPSAPSRVQIGPIGLRPALILREVGYDSNVLNEKTGEEGDFTATIGARLDVGVRLSKLAATYNTFYEYLYFKQLADERGSNRGVEGRVDFLLGRLRPHVIAGVKSSHDRPSAGDRCPGPASVVDHRLRTRHHHPEPDHAQRRLPPHRHPVRR